MTSLEIERAVALAKCTMSPGTKSKSFAGAMADMANRNPDKELTPLQARFLVDLSWKFRRQMPAHLVPAEKPNAAA
ncbi:hypothetical protein [Parvibaculum sp.]|uniref:hypothetical protein n=1 Tax=Parvibaculum sp. TaxID=2024848 RepID=UPI0027337DF1|nr:hypothetical protein [Parvibaculum sp.]MDP3327166.1 hypothetical protein [Parvibaculum sp.]